MGASASNSTSKRSRKRIYLLPNQRKKDRYMVFEEDELGGKYDPTVDKVIIGYFFCESV